MIQARKKSLDTKLKSEIDKAIASCTMQSVLRDLKGKKNKKILFSLLYEGIQSEIFEESRTGRK